MVEIQSGFNNKPTTIKIFGQENGTIELWIHETGVEGSRETLSYMSVDELYKLYEEVKTAAKDIFHL